MKDQGIFIDRDDVLLVISGLVALRSRWQEFEPDEVIDANSVKSILLSIRDFEKRLQMVIKEPKNL
jgi:hypothetical protein